MEILDQWFHAFGHQPFPGMTSGNASAITSSFTFFNDFSVTDPNCVTSVFLNELIQNSHYADAIQFLAHGLPKQQAITWAYICFKQQDDGINMKLDLIQSWLRNQAEEIRSHCGEHTNDFKDPLTWLGLSVFWSGGNISTQKDVIIEPVDTLCAHGVATALILSAVSYGLEDITKMYTTYIERGIKYATNNSFIQQLSMNEKEGS